MVFPLPPAGLQVAVSMNMIGLRQGPLLCTAAHVKEVAEAAEGWYGRPPELREMQDISYHLHRRCYPRRVRRAEASGDDNELCELVGSVDELAGRLMEALQDGSSGVQQSVGRPREVTRITEPLSSGGRHPAGTATEAASLQDGSSGAHQSVGRPRKVTRSRRADLKRLGYSGDEMPASSRSQGISNPKRPNQCSGDSHLADASGQAASKRRRTEDHEGAADEATSGARCRALVVDRRFCDAN